MSNDERDSVQLPLAREWTRAHATGQVLPGQGLARRQTDVILIPDLEAAVRRLNPSLPEGAVMTAVRDLRGLMASTSRDTLTQRAAEALAVLRTGIKVTVREHGTSRTRAVQLLDFDNPESNCWRIATEVPYTRGARSDVRFDIVIYCNGIPLVVVETKTNTDPNITWLNAARDLAGPYTRKAPAFLAAGILLVATDGREVRYAGVNTPATRFHAWRSSDPSRPVTAGPARCQWDFVDLLAPDRILSWARDYVLQLADKGTGVRSRFVPRWPQAEAAPMIVERVFDPNHNRALLDHFQGSGKTFTMLMAANAISRIDPGHLVVLVVDRVDLLTQHLGDFTDSDARRPAKELASRQKLADELANPKAAGIRITTVHRFSEAGLLSERTDVTILVDEAHRSQDGDLGRDMRASLPNATLIGLTGTPVAGGGRNTYTTFGDPADSGHILHTYSSADSVRDGTTVPLVIRRSRIVQPLDKDALDAAYAAYIADADLSSEDAETLAATLTAPGELLKDPRRIAAIAEDVHRAVTGTLLTDGYGAMVVVNNRDLVVRHVAELRKHFAHNQVTGVITGQKDDPADYAEFVRDPPAEAVVTRDFRDPTKPLKVLVVTSKLLTGFDAKNVHTVFVDKPMHKHTLFQAVTRANRSWTTPEGVEKGYGVVVDYCGITEPLLAAFDRRNDDTTTKAVASPTELRRLFATSLHNAERLLGAAFDWRADDVVVTASDELSRDAQLVQSFRRNVGRAELIWEALPGDEVLGKHKERFLLLLRIQGALKETRIHEELVVAEHGEAVRQLLWQHTGDVTRYTAADLTLGAERIQQLLHENTDPAAVVKMLQTGDVLASIRDRLAARLAGPQGRQYASIAEKLEQFAATTYVVSADGAREAVADLTALVAELKEIDDRLGEGWDEIDRLLHQRRTTPAPQSTVANPATALQDVLAAYSPAAKPAAVDSLASVLDRAVEKVSYRNLRENTSVQRQLRASLLQETARLGVKPRGKAATQEFIEKLVDYVNTWML